MSKKIVAIGAHPDDIEMNIGGTLLKHKWGSKNQGERNNKCCKYFRCKITNIRFSCS